MFKARYYKADGKKGRARELPAAIFDGIVNNGAMHQVVKAYLSNQRQGTASAKTRSDVAAKRYRSRKAGDDPSGAVGGWWCCISPYPTFLAKASA